MFAQTLSLINLSWGIDMKKIYSDLYINIISIEGDVLKTSNVPFADEDIFIGDMVIEEDVFS